MSKEEMEIHLDHDIAEGDIIEILNFLETNLDCEIRFKSYFTDHYYQLKEDNQYDENGPFTINEDGSLLYIPNDKGLNISTKEQKSAVQAGQNYPEGYPITCDHGEVNLKKPFYWGDCYTWATGILKNEDLINKIKEFLEEYEDMEEEEIREQGWYLFVEEFLELGSFVEEHLGNLESEGLIVYKKKEGFGTSFGLDNISWCVMDKTDQTEISWLVKKKFLKKINKTKKIENNFYENGKIYKEEYEVNSQGKKHGYYKIFHENGVIKFNANFSNDIQDDGNVISYHPDGSKAREVTIVNHLRNGDFTEWYENGNIKTQGYYNKDFCVIEEQFYDNGELIDFKKLRFNDEQLNLAFDHWKDNSEDAEAKYGHISSWDTAQVTDVTDIYFEAKHLNIDVSKWSLNFKRNGLSYKQTAENSFTTYHENGNIKFEYLELIWMKGSEPYDELRIDFNQNTKCVAYDEDGKEIEEFTVFYVPNTGDSIVIFKVNKNTPMYFKNFTNKNYITNDLCNRNPHIINLTGDNKIDLKKYPPIVIESESSQCILDDLLEWVPNKKFVLVYRWNRLWEDDGYEDYLSGFYEPSEVAVMCHYDKIFITGEKSRDEDPGKEITEFKCDGGDSRKMLEEMCRFSHYDFDELRIFEEEIFYNLNESFTAIYCNEKVHEFDSQASRDKALQGDDYVEMLDIDGIKFKVAKRLNLNVDEYKKPKFI